MDLVNSTGKVTAKKAGTANITVRVNGFMEVCKVTVVNPPEQLVSFKSLRGKSFTYKNSKYSFGIGFGKTNNNVYIGVWNLSGIGSSVDRTEEVQDAYRCITERD